MKYTQYQREIYNVRQDIRVKYAEKRNGEYYISLNDGWVNRTTGKKKFRTTENLEMWEWLSDVVTEYEVGKGRYKQMRKTETVILRISERDKEKLKERAEDEQMTMSEYLLWLIRKDVAEHLDLE